VYATPCHKVKRPARNRPLLKRERGIQESETRPVAWRLFHRHDGAPVPKARPRVSRSGFVYTPAKTRLYEEQLKASLTQTVFDNVDFALFPVDGAVRVDVLVELDIPKSWSKKKRAAGLAGEVVPVARPDLDNFVKTALDAANGVVFRDDSQVVSLSAIKKYSPGAALTITAAPFFLGEDRV